MVTAISTRERDSSFELMRIISQYMIVLGHILGVVVYPRTNEPFYTGVMWLLHTAVPIFIMISGYFGIRASVKGVVNLLKFVVVLYIPLLIIQFIVRGGVEIKDIASILFPISRTNTWFIRTYLWLYLLSPMINLAIKNSTIEKRILYIGILFLISNYSGIVGDDVTLLQGKNIITFTFYYMVGNLLSESRNKWIEFDAKGLLFFWLLINILIIGGYTFVGADGMRKEVFEFVFTRYNSPMLWLNAVLSFILLAHIKIQSSFINKIAKSCLAIYILHCSYVSWSVVKPACIYLLDSFQSIFVIFAAVVLLALLVTILCIVIYFLFTPIWFLFDSFSAWIQNKSDKIWDNVSSKLSHYMN